MTTPYILYSEALQLTPAQLYSLEPESFSQLRLVSRSLNELAVPFIYRDIKLREIVLDPSAKRFPKDAARQIQCHAKHVTIQDTLDWDLAAQFLRKCRQLKTLTLVSQPNNEFDGADITNLDG